MTIRTTALLCFVVALPLVESLGLLRNGSFQQRDASLTELHPLFQEDSRDLMHKMVGLYDLSMSMSMPALSFSMPLTAAPMVLETFPTVSPSSVPSTSQPPAQSETASPTLRTVADFGLASDVSSSSRIAVTIGGGSKSAGAIITMLIGSIGVGLLVLASRRSRNAVSSSITSNDELASETGGA